MISMARLQSLGWSPVSVTSCLHEIQTECSVPIFHHHGDFNCCYVGALKNSCSNLRVSVAPRRVFLEVHRNLLSLHALGLVMLISVSEFCVQSVPSDLKKDLGICVAH